MIDAAPLPPPEHAVAMSAAKRARRQQSGAGYASPSPASKRLKTTPSSHVPAPSGLGFLVDENARNGTKLHAQLTNGVPSSKATRVDESHAKVAENVPEDEAPEKGGKASTPISISSRESSSEVEPDENELDAQHVNGQGGEDGEAQIGAEDDRMEGVETAADEGAGQELALGEMMQARHPDPINVHQSLSGPKAPERALVPATGSRALDIPSTTSLATVLAQALKTNDKDRLEACFQVTDLPSIRSSIQRLPSQHAAELLQRLAERIHKRPGRTGNLMIWIQWVLVTHGGYLATQPEVMKRMKALLQVVKERASGLQPLLLLKGKLDILSAQLELRRNLQAESRAAHAVSDEDEAAVLYVDGQDDGDWSEEDDEVEDGKLLMPPAKRTKNAVNTSAEADDDDESGEDTPNGVAQEVDEDSEVDEDEQGMFDEEAEETSNDEDEEADSDEEAESGPESDADTDLSEDDSEPEIKPAQPKTLNRKR
jgi:U3 small nucleolar RNA-associated protein 5